MNQKKFDKITLIKKLQDSSNPYILFQVERILEREEKLESLKKVVEEYPMFLEEAVQRDMSIKTKQKTPEDSFLGKYENIMTPVMYILGLFMLILAAALINLLANEGENITVAIFQSRVAGLYLIGWFLFVLEFGVMMWIKTRSGIKINRTLIIGRSQALLFPPVRMGSRHLINPDLQWIPFLGWSFRNEGLLKFLKEKFSIPMIVIALLIIPVLVIEWKFYEEVQGFLHTDLSFVLDLTQAFIWLAFAFEFILMVSISREKLDYIQKNWIDLLIILLPFIAFVRTMRIIKVARLSQLARGYKLRGLLMKARQGLFFAGFFYRILTFRNYQMKTIKKKLEKNQKEKEVLEEELIELYTNIDKKDLP
ncbi:MAG: hypothetical protein EA341_04415 [Mongoliibacter sp.]|uniref:hypothetical protein n=1 Tax=Mongoliibacter sp. TaxID=2022438 RepID=UPI0012F3090D|nr:hypothetical protein [Mongoliibacter sp.]TVP51799.1 MAG: hypothetical protein EA341_04415 [Mongoliibacter sp.]